MNGVIVKGHNGDRSVFAERGFKKDEIIFPFRGKIYHRADNPRGLYAQLNHYLQIGPNEYLGPTRSADNFVNHSCIPNCVVVVGEKVFLKAIRDIQPGDEITFDYSTTMVENGRWEMECKCGCPECRKKVGDFKKLPEDVKKKYIRLGVVPDYVRNS